MTIISPGAVNAAPVSFQSITYAMPVAAKHPPLVLIPADNRMFGDVADGGALQPLLRRRARSGRLPADPAALHRQGRLDAYLSIADGVMLTGSPANVHPSHFGQNGARWIAARSTPCATPRLPLIRRVARARHAASHDLPWLAREINVALGGSAASGHSGSCRGATTIAAPVARCRCADARALCAGTSGRHHRRWLSRSDSRA